METDIRKQVHQFALSHNLDRLTGYHNEIKRLLSNELITARKSKKKEKGISDIRDYYIKELHPKLINNTFLMMFAYLEEMLCIILKSFAKIDETSSKTGLEKYKESFKKDYDIKLSQFPGWSFLADASDIRNALLHANGNISHLRKPEKTKNILKNYKKDIKLKRNVMFINETYLNSFLKKIDEVKDWLLEKV
jgi:hypothetical protein